MIGHVAELVGPNAKVLDLGCGTGIPTARFFTEAGCAVIGVDHAERMLDLANTQVPGATFINADIRALSFADGEFDAVTAFFSLLMLSKKDMGRMLQSIHDWLRPGAYFALSMVNFDGDGVPVSFLGTEFNVSGYDPDGLRRVLTAARFQVMRLAAVEYEPPGQASEAQIFALCQRNGRTA
jgi:ubiquinone/menaquinone biosynthesis C-methylase UbiE